MTVSEIACKLVMSEKNVQSYIPYSRGMYGGDASPDAIRSGEYRKRMKHAAKKMHSRNGRGEVMKDDMKSDENYLSEHSDTVEHENIYEARKLLQRNSFSFSLLCKEHASINKYVKKLQ